VSGNIVLEVVCEHLVDVMLENEDEQQWGDGRKELKGFKFKLKTNGCQNAMSIAIEVVAILTY